MNEIIALEEQRLTGRPCERVGKTIAKIQFGGMSATFSEIAIRLTCNSRVNFCHGLNDDLCLLDEIIEPTASDGIATPVDHERGFDEVSR